MTAFRAIAACIAVCCLLFAPGLGPEAHASPSPMVDKINQVRGAYGLRALRYSPSLARSSGRYARYLVRTHRFEHSSRIWASSRFLRLGETLARTRSRIPSRLETIDDWLASPSHRAVLLSRSFSYVGAGRAFSGRGARAAVLWAVHFGH